MYLALVLSNQGVESTVRQAAGIALKAHIETFFAQIPQEHIQSIQPLLKSAFEQDSSPVVRKAIKSVMSTIIMRGGINVWRDLFYYLADNLKSTDQTFVADCLHTISMIVEDV